LLYPSEHADGGNLTTILAGGRCDAALCIEIYTLTGRKLEA